MKTTIIKLVTTWLDTNTEKSEAKKIIIKVIEWLQTIAANAENIISGSSIIPDIDPAMPAWANDLKLALEAAVAFVPGTLLSIVNPILADLTSVLDQLSAELNVVPVTTPLAEQTPSHSALLATLADIAEAANNILKIAPTASGNIQAITTMANNGKVLVQKLVNEVKK